MTDERLARLAASPVGDAPAGEGPPLVLLHGDGESRVGWRAVAPRLAERWRVVAPDLPGYGDAGPAADVSPEGLAAWVLDLLDALGVEAAPLVGSSLGGLVAVEVARAAPERVRGLVLVDAAGLGRWISPVLGAAAMPGVGELNVALAALPAVASARSEARRRMLFADPRRAPAWWRDEMRRLSRPRPAATSVAVRRDSIAPWGQRRVVLDALPGISAPTLVVWGRDDLIVPVSQGRDAVERLPDGRLEVVPDCGHLPHVERPDRFLGAVEPFLASLAA